MATGLSNRAAGTFARERFRARRRAWWRRVWWVFPVLAVFEVVVPVGVGLLLHPDNLAFYWGFGLGVAVALVIALGDSPPHHIERWREGADGEKATAKARRQLVKQGWVLINDIEVGRGNIDHVIVGPPGVFVLDSKNLSGTLAINRGVLAVRWREDPADGYENRRLTPRMQTLGREVEQLLQADGLGRVPVQPVVVIWGRFDQRSILSCGVAWVRGQDLQHVLETRPRYDSTEDLSAAAASIRSLDPICRRLPRSPDPS